MHSANAQRRNHFIQHDRRTDQYQYSRQNSHETPYNRNNVTNPSAQNGSWKYRGRNNDHFNNWNTATRNDEDWRQGGGPAVYERAPRRDDGARDFVGRPDPQRAQHFPSQRVVQDWETNLNQRNEGPEVDEWGREIRRRASTSSEEDNDRERNRPRMNRDISTQNMENGRGHYERPQKRQRSWERENRDDRYIPANNYFHRSHHPAVNKRPRLESFPSHQSNTWNKPANHFPHRSHPTERDHLTDGFADDINQFEVPILTNVNMAPVTPPVKGYYSRKPAVQVTRGSDIPTTDFPKAENPELSSLPLSAQLDALSSTISSLTPLIASSPSVANAASPTKAPKPAKSALVKQFFFDDDDDEEIPALPPLQDTTPTTNLPVQSTVQVDSKPSPSLPENKAPTPILPLSPVSKSPPTPCPKVASASPQETTMDISPIDTTNAVQQSDTQKGASDILSKISTAGSRVLKPKNVQDNPAPSANNEPFEFLGLVGIGAYGKVFKAKEMSTGKLVALKKIRTESQHDGFPVTALREIKLLQSLHHTNVVTLQEMVMRKGFIFLSFEYVEHDLVGLLHQTEFTLLPEHIKSLAKQLCEGLAYIHSRSVLHRDLKTANLLVTSQGTLKLGDFGLARFFNKRKQADYTNRVCTYWYRAPELMLGETVYGPEIDIWSAGCIFMEMFLKTPPFCAEEEVDQLQAVCTVLGTPTEEYAPHLLQRPWYPLLSPVTASENIFRDKFTSVLPCDALEFAGRLLHMDGAQRPSASVALDDTYFSTEPVPSPPNLYVMKTDWHEYEYQNWRRKERHAQELRPSATTQML